jgi:hypothetical protein
MVSEASPSRRISTLSECRYSTLLRRGTTARYDGDSLDLLLAGPKLNRLLPINEASQLRFEDASTRMQGDNLTWLDVVVFAR